MTTTQHRTQRPRTKAQIRERRRALTTLRRLDTPLGITPGALQTAFPRIPTWTLALIAAALIAALYIIGGWWNGTLNAIEVMLHGYAGGTFALAPVLRELARAIITITACLLLLWLLARHTGHTPTDVGLHRPAGARPRSSLTITILALGIVNISFMTGQLFGLIPGIPEMIQYPNPPAPTPGQALVRGIDTMLSGASEELALLALPVVLLRALRTPWWAIALVTVALRAPFHLYYGIALVPGLIAWPILMVILFAATGRIWPIFVAHMLRNGTSYLYVASLSHGTDLAQVLAELTSLAINLGAILATLFITQRIITGRTLARRAAQPTHPGGSR